MALPRSTRWGEPAPAAAPPAPAGRGRCRRAQLGGSQKSATIGRLFDSHWCQVARSFSPACPQPGPSPPSSRLRRPQGTVGTGVLSLWVLQNSGVAG